MISKPPRDAARQEHRRKRLIDLLNEFANGRQNALINMCAERGHELSDVLISQYVNGKRDISERTVDKIEAAMNLKGWFAEGRGITRNLKAVPIYLPPGLEPRSPSLPGAQPSRSAKPAKAVLPAKPAANICAPTPEIALLQDIAKMIGERTQAMAQPHAPSHKRASSSGSKILSARANGKDESSLTDRDIDAIANATARLIMQKMPIDALTKAISRLSEPQGKRMP